MANPPSVTPRFRWFWWPVLAALGGVLAARLAMRGFAMVCAGLLLALEHPDVQTWFWLKGIASELSKTPAAPPARPVTEANAPALATRASALRAPAELFDATAVWDAHLRFNSNEWAALQPVSVTPIRRFIRPDGTAILRNPAASRSGLAGVMGIDLPWSRGALEFGDLTFTNLAARYKGNGTFLAAVAGHKRPFKLDLDKHTPGQLLVGRDALNFHNLAADRTSLCDTLAYEFFREAGVPASRTAFARVRLSVEGRFEDRLLGLYALVENPDARWARERFGVEGLALFKPVTMELFSDLGDDWEAYAPIYDPKSKLTSAQEQRLIALAKLVSGADDDRFAAEVGGLIDVPAFATFLACQSLLSNYDSILSNGQNFLLYLDPRTDRFGFIPWDHDHCWGQFPFIGSADQRARASVRRPWVGENHFLQRMLAVPAVRENYEAELRRLRETLFVPERLSQRLDELAAVVRPWIAEESADRLARFEFAVGEEKVEPQEQTSGAPWDRIGYPLKQFFAERAKSVSDQLEGRAEGVVLQRNRLR